MGRPKILNRDPSDPLRVRRHVALFCLFTLIGTLAAFLALAYWGQPTTADVLGAAAAAIGIILTSLTGMVGAWFHAAYKSDRETTRVDDGIQVRNSPADRSLDR